MSKKSRKDYFGNITKLVIGLIFVLSFFSAKGDISKTVENMASAAKIFILAGTVFVIFYVIYKFFPFSDKASCGDNNTSIEALPKAEIKDCDELTMQNLHQLEWRCFEILVELFLNAEGVKAQRYSVGPDDGIDLIVREDNSEFSQIVSIIQCKAWKTSSVGVSVVRELYGVMVAKNARNSYLFSITDFTEAAQQFAIGKSIKLVNSKQLILDFNKLERETGLSILKQVFSGDFTTPTCPSCDVKMVKRKSKYGEFWGCARFPKCKYKLNSGVVN